MYLKFKVSPVGMKSNSKTTPFVTVPAAKIFKCGSDATLAVAGRLFERLVELFGPWAAVAFPVVNNICICKAYYISLYIICIKWTTIYSNI